MDAVRPWLYVGKLAETLNAESLRRHGIGAVLQLCRDARTPGVETFYLSVADCVPLPADALTRGVAFVLGQRESGRVVLVACGRGVSRSAAFATAALKAAEGLPLLDAFAQVAAARPEARPHPALWQSLCDHFGEAVPAAEMLRVCRPARTPWT